MFIFESEGEYCDRLLQNAAAAISTKRGEFYPQCDYGCELASADKSERALSQARRALKNARGIFPVSACKTQKGWSFSLLVNGVERQVSAEL